jgi:hypothetical protein
VRTNFDESPVIPRIFVTPRVTASDGEDGQGKLEPLVSNEPFEDSGH